MFVATDFNPRSPHGERPARNAPDIQYYGISTHAPRTGSDALKPGSLVKRNGISTHAPRTGSDAVNCFKFRRRARFQPTLPARGAT